MPIEHVLGGNGNALPPIIGQPEQRLRPLFREEKVGDTVVRFLSFDGRQTVQTIDLPYMKDRKVMAKRNGGCSFVLLARLGDVTNTSLKLANIPGTLFGLEMSETFRYMVHRVKFMLLIKVFKEEQLLDGNSVGVTTQIYLNDVENSEQVYVTQTQESLHDTDLAGLEIMRKASIVEGFADDATVGGSDVDMMGGAPAAFTTAPVAFAEGGAPAGATDSPPSVPAVTAAVSQSADPSPPSMPAGIDIAYMGIYDRALNLSERRLIARSVQAIIDGQVTPSIKPAAVVDFDITQISAEILDADPDSRRMVKDLSPNKFHLMYNVEGQSVSAQYRLANTQTKCLELTKNEKFFTPTPVNLDTSNGYTIELLFCIREFSSENDSAIFCYATQDANVRVPQLIVSVSSNRSSSSDNINGDGNRLSVFFTHDIPRFECLINLRTNKWYHAVITSDSKIYLNGSQVPTTGRAVTWLPDVIDRGRYLTLGDHNVADSYRVTTDTGISINGFIAVSRFYTAPINDELVKELHRKLRDDRGGQINAYSI